MELLLKQRYKLSILKKFKQLNNFNDKDNFYQVIFRNIHVGYIHKKVVEHFINTKFPICIINKRFYILETNTKRLNIIMHEIGKMLINKNYVDSLAEELFPCVKFLGGQEYFSLDRSIVEILGIKGYGVHLISYIKKNNRIKLWVPKRASFKKVAPNKLDNTVAGGVSSKESIYDALSREAYEEAGINKALIKKAKLTGTLNYQWRNKKYSLRRDTLYLFELEVNHSFMPSCKDGEVEKYQLLDWQDTLENIKQTDNFKKNSALVTIIFLIRKGLINPRNENDYEKINSFIN